MVRRKRNIQQMLSWRSSKIDTCSYCDKKVEYILKTLSWWGTISVFLCKEHHKQWELGELYI
jgi:hypothetical protein